MEENQEMVNVEIDQPIEFYREILNTNEEIIDLLGKIHKTLGWAILLIVGLLVWKLFEITSLMREMRLY